MNHFNPTLSADDSLLDILSARAGCGFLSDLHLPDFRSRALCAIKQTPAEDFSAEEWTRAVYYITELPNRFQHADDARTYLLRWLQATIGQGT